MEWIFKILGLTSFINWIRPAFQDEQNQASFRRINPFLLTWLCIYMIVADKIPPGARLAAFYAILLAAAFYAGLITFQNIYSMYTAWRGGGNGMIIPTGPPSGPFAKE